jgi:hypothetical protein
MDLIEVDNPSLRCMVLKIYARPSLDLRRIGELVDLLSTPAEGHAGLCLRALPRLVRLRRGQGLRRVYTHQSVDKQLVEVLEPMNRRVYDGCCGSGGMVVQAERFVEVDGGQHRAAAHIGLKPSHLSHQLRVFRRLGPQQQNRDHRHLHAQPPARRGPPHCHPVTAPRGHQRPDRALAEPQTDFADQ